MNDSLSEEDLKTRILTESVNLVFESLNTAVISTFVGIFLIFLLVKDTSNITTLYSWTACYTAVLIARFFLGFFYKHANNPEEHLNLWKNLFILGTAASGLIWGVGGVVLISDAASTKQFMLILVLLGFVVASSASLFPLPLSLYAYTGLTCLPVVARHLFSDFDQSHVVTLSILLASGFIISTSIRQKNDLVKRIILQSDNEVLVDRLRFERDSSQDLNTKLSTEIQERKRIQEALQDSQDALIHNKEIAESANRAKSDFLSNMSHELRTPLNAIIGYSDIMKRQVFGKIGNEKYEEYPTYINDAGAHLLSIVNNMLDISKIEAGAFEIDESLIEVDEIIASSVLLVNKQAQEKGIEITQDISDHFDACQGDPLRIKQILVNFLGNAVKFTPSNGEINIGTFRDSQGDGVFYVNDTGDGMDNEGIKIALEPFGQVDNLKDGTGLGIPICKKLIEAHGGEMRIESQRGHGTTIAFSLPKHRIKKQNEMAAKE